MDNYNNNTIHDDSDLNAENPEDRRILRVINTLAARRQLMAEWDDEIERESLKEIYGMTTSLSDRIVSAATGMAATGMVATGAIAPGVATGLVGAAKSLLSRFGNRKKTQPTIDELIAAGRNDEALRLIDSRIAGLLAVGAPSDAAAKDEIYELVWLRIKALCRKGDAAAAREHLKTYVEIKGGHHAEAMQLYSYLTDITGTYRP